MRSLRAGDSAKERPPCYDERLWWTRMRSGIRCDCVALQLAAAPSCWFQARRVQRAHRESNTGWAAGCNRIFNRGPPARRPGSAPAGVPRPGSAALRPVRLAAPRGGLAAGGETTAESGVHISMRPGAGSNSRCGFKFEISRAVRVLKLDSEVALPRSLPGSGAWEQAPLTALGRTLGISQPKPAQQCRPGLRQPWPGSVPLDMRARDDSALTEVGCSPQAAAACKLKGTPGPGPQQGA